MDANGLHFWLLADGDDWSIVDGLVYDSGRRTLRLESVSDRLPPGMDPAHPPAPPAADRREWAPRARDAHGTQAYWDGGRCQVMARGALPAAVPILTVPADDVVDLALGYDGALYVALASGDLILQDRRGRWSPVRFQMPGLEVWRVAPDPAGGVWLLDRQQRRLGRFEGLPLTARPAAPGVSRQCQENPHPPRVTLLDAPICDATEVLVGVACSPGGRVAVLSARGADDQALVRLVPACPSTARTGWSACSQPGRPLHLARAVGAYSLAWLSEELLAVLLAHVSTEAPVYPVDQVRPGDELRPLGEMYPLPGHDGGPFLHGVDAPPHLPVPRAPGSLPLRRLSLPSFAYRGAAGGGQVVSYDAEGHAQTWSRLDSGSSRTVWHRLYLEGDLPPECGVRVFVTASDQAALPEDGRVDWFAHDFGQCPDDRASPAEPAHPRGAWVPAASELPFHPGLRHCPRIPNRCGLFTVLFQRGNRRVRTLRGRYLHARVELYGNGRATPEVAALRAYASRFSYAEHYLPELYRESCFGPEADEKIGEGAAHSTPPDFLERFLDNLEGILTPLEDRVAGAYLLADPHSAPEEALEWLGSWIGMAFDPATPVERRREMLAQAPALYRQHGTVPGMERAIDIATGGAVKGGEVVVLEDWRLRRTLATILGADFAEEDDPLVPGLSVSGNSFVGDTLFLGDEHREEFMALYSADLTKLSSEERAIAGLYDRLAHRVTVLVHREVEPQDLGLIARVVALETPAHVEAKVLTATWPFLVGVASLVGIDSYLGERPPQRPVRVGYSQIGVRDLLLHPASLDPRLERGAYLGPEDLGGQVLTIDMGGGA